MTKEIKVVANYNYELTSLLWISLQDEGSISIGMSDRSFIIPGLVSQVRVDGKLHQSQVDFEGKLSKSAITNPHFTFHPPMYVHLRANNEEELFSGILGVDFIIELEGKLPWIRFVSSPLKELKPFKQVRYNREIEIISFLVTSDDISLHVGIDFVAHQDVPMEKNEQYINWHGRVLHIFGQELPAQKSTIQWNHES